jgi:DNA-binding transcriptional ArsR family regulator
MSIKYINHCFNCEHFQPLEKLLLFVLCDNSNEEGYCYPSYKNIIKRTSMARATVSKHLKTLKNSGVITVGNHSVFGKGKAVNTYNISKFWADDALKTKLIEARKTLKVQGLNLTKSSRVEPIDLVQGLNYPSSRVEPLKVQGLDYISSRVEHEPSINHHIEPPMNHQLTAPEKKVTEKKEPKSKAVWIAYAKAYESRYNSPPMRNAGINSMLCKFVDNVGINDAPLIAEYYLRLNDSWYLKIYHDVSSLLKNAQAIRTQWLNNTNRTSIDHKNTERKSTTLSAVDAVKAKIARGEL